MNIVFLYKHPAAVKVNRQLSAGKLTGLQGILRTAVNVQTAQSRTDARKQLRCSKRRGDVIIRSQIERFHLVALMCARRDYQDRNLRPTANGSDYLTAVHVR